MFQNPDIALPCRIERGTCISTKELSRARKVRSIGPVVVNMCGVWDSSGLRAAIHVSLSGLESIRRAVDFRDVETVRAFRVIRGGMRSDVKINDVIISVWNWVQGNVVNL